MQGDARGTRLLYQSFNTSSAYLLIYLSVNTYFYMLSYWYFPPFISSIWSVRWYVDQLIYLSIDMWILISGTWNRHSPYINLFQSIVVYAPPLIDKSGNVSWRIMSYCCVPPSVSSFRWYINWSINQPIGEYWCIWFKIDMAYLCYLFICVRL